MESTRPFALQLLRAVLDQHRPLEEALDRLPATADLRDRAAAHRLAATVLRRAGTLDAVIEPHLKRAPPDAVRWILWLGAAGLLFLETPPHAAVGTAVDLARSQKLAPFAGLVNAVLRRVAEGGRGRLGGSRFAAAGYARLALGVLGRQGPRDRCSASDGSTARPFAETGCRSAPWQPSAANGNSARLPAGTRVADLPGFAEGDVWVQDAAAALPALLLAPQKGERIADLCAAPGGKTAQLAAAGAQVTAVESSEKRLPRLRENLARLKLTADIVQADATLWRPDDRFDAILLDAPCSATGTIRRHPDLPFIKRAQDIATLVAGQDRLLEAASDMLRPGGRLIYAVCSLQAEEGAQRTTPNLAPDPFTAKETEAIPGRHENGIVRTDPSMWPDEGGLDGFQIVRYRRK